MKKILVLLISALLLVGCTTHSSITYNVDTGDSITIQITTSDGYKFTQTDLPFKISKGDDYLVGRFNTATDYTVIVLELEDHDVQDVDILDRGENGTTEYLLFSWNTGTETEYFYIIYVKNSDTSIQLMTTVSQEFIQECYKGMTISKE